MKTFGLPLALCAALPLVVLAACSGGGSTSAMLPAARPMSSDALNSTPALSSSSMREELSMAVAPPAADVAASSDLLYVSNSNNSITVYHQDAKGDAAPLYVIAGSKTKLSAAAGLSQDAAGNLYVANGSSVLVFAHGAHGNVAPLRTLGGSRTGFANAGAVTVDQSTGKIYVADNYDPDPYSNKLLRFAPNSSGNVPPFAAAQYAPTNQLASDSSGRNLIEAAGPTPDGVIFSGIYTTPKQFANNADLPDLYAIRSIFSYGVADDPTTKSYVMSSAEGIYRFAEDTNGVGPLNFVGAPPKYTPAPRAVITSAPNCGQLAVGYGRNIFAICGNAVKVYAPTANGAAVPLRTLSGAATELHGPVGIYEGK